MRSHAPRSIAVLLLAASSGGCHVPRFKGPQIQSPPPAFTMRSDTYQERRMFPGREVLHHDAWVEASSGDFSGIYINAHAGALTLADAADARAAAMSAPKDGNVTYGDLETLTVDGRKAWGWSESWRNRRNGGLDWVAYRAVIPYDTISYAVEFISGEPGLKLHPDSLRVIVASFADGKTTWNLPLLLAMAAVLVFFVGTTRKRMSERAARARSVPLARIQKKKEGEDKPAQEG